MTPRFSLYLDAARFSAALVVLISHFAYPRISGGDFAFIRDLNIGSDAVAVFFVLSGFVIAHAAATKDRDLAAFGFSRATRVLSVAVPAVLLTLLLDAGGAALVPAAYDGWWYNDAPVLEQALPALSFTNELWFASNRLGTNGPYWSLAYEVWYYAIFGAAMYLRGLTRIATVAIAALIAGPKILLLAPVWLLGVYCYHAARAPMPPRTIARFLAAAPPLLYVACLALGIPGALTDLTKEALGAAFVEHALKFSDQFLWNTLIGVFCAAHFLGMNALMREKPAPDGRMVRWLAGASFSLYLVHYPLMQFTAALCAGRMDVHAANAVILLTTLAGCFLFAQLFERPLPRLRTALRRLGARDDPGLTRTA